MSILKSLVFASLLTAPLAGCALDTSTSDLDRASEGNQEYEGVGEGGCAFTQGYWKHHPDAWPVDSLALGATTYSKAQLLDILARSARVNGVVELAHQLIAAKLNIAIGADDRAIAGDIDACDALLAGRMVPPFGSGALSLAATSELVLTLEEFNSTAQCELPPPPPEPVCGNGIAEEGEECDDGNADDHDACGNDCTLCPATEPGCGNGVVEPGEECDDGNTNDSDGCSNTCHIYIG
jgi:cysteine-rich repeat protein